MEAFRINNSAYEYFPYNPIFTEKHPKRMKKGFQQKIPIS